MSQSQSMRRCPRCKTIGRLFKSHPRNKFERFFERIFGNYIGKYRCHQCNWRGYMHRKYKQNPRLAYFLFMLILIGGVFLVVYGIPKLLSSLSK